MKIRAAILIAAALVAAAPAVAGERYRYRPTPDGYTYQNDRGRKVFNHYSPRLGGYPAPRCYTSGKRTDCYYRNPATMGRDRFRK
jgi:hypothetical protein